MVANIYLFKSGRVGAVRVCWTAEKLTNRTPWPWKEAETSSSCPYFSSVRVWRAAFQMIFMRLVHKTFTSSRHKMLLCLRSATLSECDFDFHRNNYVKNNNFDLSSFRIRRLWPRWHCFARVIKNIIITF